MQLLVHNYQTKDGRVNYRKFVQDVNEGFIKQNLEKAPKERAPSPSVTMDTLKNHYGFDDPMMEDLYQELKEIIQRHCSTYGMSIRGSFKDFDYINQGTVTMSQFERNLPTPNDFDPYHVRVSFYQ